MSTNNMTKAFHIFMGTMVFFILCIGLDAFLSNKNMNGAAHACTIANNEKFAAAIPGLEIVDYRLTWYGKDDANNSVKVRGVNTIVFGGIQSDRRFNVECYL